MTNKEAIEILKPLFDQCKGTDNCLGYIEHYFSKDEEKALDLAIQALEERQQGEWIPVSERLPEDYGNYLVFTSDNDIDIGTYHPVTYHPRMWSMCDANGFYWADNKNIEVLAWKPLPKPYESEAENG